MVPYKYGEFADMQLTEVTEILRKRIFFLLLVAEDMETKERFPDVNLETANTTLLWRISGLNKLLGEPPELVTVLSLLEEAKSMITHDFNYAKYRKLILDAGNEITKISPRYKSQSANTAPQE
ncbi:MAG: hypothetical protein J6O49_09795 [Bacteroidaceae bacterium]|nr:hypothetical protein [Bacteroidaceae bacterium]